jgi:hypothetical protein
MQENVFDLQEVKKKKNMEYLKDERQAFVVL